MQIDEKLIDSLTKIGLQKYQAQVYITSAILGEATAYLIAKESNVPRSKVYEVLDSLVDLGFITKIPSERGISFQALPLEDTLDNAINKMVSNIAEVKKQIEFLHGEQPGKSTEPLVIIFNNTNSLIEMIKQGEYYEAWIDNKINIANDLLQILTSKECEIHFISSIQPISFILGPNDSYFIRGKNGSLYMIKFSNKIIQQILDLIEKTKPDIKKEIARKSGIKILRETSIQSIEDKIKLVIPGFDWKTEHLLFWGIIERTSGAFICDFNCDCFITESRILMSTNDARIWARALKFVNKVQFKDDFLIITFTKVDGFEDLIIESKNYLRIIESLIQFILKK